MTQAQVRFQNFEDYLSFDDGTENLYELFNGELIQVPPESGKNVAIAGFLFVQFALLIGHLRVRGQGLELEVRGEPKNRYPDLTIIREEHIEQLEKRNTLRFFMAPPLVVMEVVSPGELQRDRDYIAKRMQYQDREIPEYWIIDPSEQKITILQLVEGLYEEQNYQGNQRIISLTFPELNLTVEQLLEV
ncbi:MAG TPA: hypothetical protein DEF27_06700 [Oscillatoriales bacterium UBA8482]|nr:hypothetical protein [Oscillatoriales bacterium UBA8482]